MGHRIMTACLVELVLFWPRLPAEFRLGESSMADYAFVERACTAPVAFDFGDALVLFV